MSSLFVTIGVLIVAILLILAVVLISMTWRAWWLYPAWEWFFVPLGAPPISFWHFTALIALVNALTFHSDDKKDDRKTDWSKLVVVIVWPMFTWVILWWLK